MSQGLFICTWLNGFKYRKGLNSSIWPIDRTLTGTTTLGQSGPESNGNDRLHSTFPKAPGLEPHHQSV